MKIDKEKLNKLLALPDEQLWAEIVRVGAGYGFTLPKNAPPKEQIDRLRSTVKGDRVNAADAIRILGLIRKGKDNG